MQPINTHRLQASLDAGHTLDPTTIQQLLNTVKDYQENPRTAGPGIQTPPIKALDQQIQTFSEYLLGNGQHWDNNPILDIVQQQAREMQEHAARRGLTYDPTTLRLQIIPEPSGNRVRFTALGTYKEQS